MAFVLLPEAEADLDAIWIYVARRSGSIEIANRMVEMLSERCRLIGLQSQIGRRRDDLGPGLRSFATGEYVILYRLAGEDALILQVIHGNRDLDALLKD
jgi:toxin ParE1/3/4